ncbi:hypothetical protein [Youngiibacter multivorans]|uniref:Glycosyltransferase family 4 protein n=1 Tax=Youngiibacter multivorans TaxID=937251 RepID=A0ABS4G688_9CLOT|nr:hypothetical protein [Youngiibacter multivorans]MBP1920095.1 hypothetical protein [Youngiibacter multivorans]
MKKRLFILTNDPVPYGTANANYIRNFAKSVSNANWHVIVIGMKNDDSQREIYKVEDKDDFDIEYWNLNASRIGWKNYLKVYFTYDKSYQEALNKFNANRNDYIYLYSTELSTAKAVVNFYKIENNHKAYGEVEWFQSFQYKYKSFNPLYHMWKKGFLYRVRNFEKAIPISRNLEKFCQKHDCKTLVVPALVDTNIIGNGSSITQDGVVHFIYPGAASDKDSFLCMLTAFSRLSEDEKKIVRFHLTSSMNYKKLKTIFYGSEIVLEKLKDILVYHGWMEYQDLLNLYWISDYLLLARARNTVTISNFPSKVPEMMNYGIVPVCSRVGDYTSRYLKDGFDSIQFNEDNTESCIEALRKAIEIKKNKELSELKRNARLTAVNIFDYRNWGNQITQFLQS